MFHHFCSLLITSLYWQHAASRHIVQQPFYPPYSDYSYTYSGPGPFHQSFQHHHSPFFSPPGTYFDQRQGILRPFPGGGVPVLVDYHKRCSDNFVGLRAHPDQQQYYYVCKPDCVIFGKCQNLQIFNATSSQCAQHPPPEYIPTCTGVGRFPLFSDCHLYFKCDEDLQPKIYSCPISMVFSPASRKCIDGNKCTPTQIAPQSSYMPEICANKFPPCFENGIFRSPSDCSLYYKCDLKKDGVYMQTRLKCSQGNFYDLQKKDCLPAKEVACDCIQVAELVYPKANSLPFQPAVYPAQFDLDSLIDGQYPVEQTNDSVIDVSKDDCKSNKNEITAGTETTTLSPLDSNNEVVEQNDLESTILSDYIDVVGQGVTESEEDDELAPVLINSSEEIADAEGSGFESNAIKDSFIAVTTARTEETAEPATTISIDPETTDEPSALIEEEEILGQNVEKIDTTNTLSGETEAKEHEASTTISDTPQSLQSIACDKLENEKTSDADTQTKNASQTHIKKCFTKRTPMKITDLPEKQNEHNSTTLTLVTTTTHTPTAKSTTTTENLINTQIPNEPITTIPERDKLEKNLLDSALRLETAGTTQSSEKTLTQIEKVTRHPEWEDENRETSSEAIPSIHVHSVNTNSLEQDISYEDLLESEITKKTKAEFLEANNETKLRNLDKEFSTQGPPAKALERLELQEIEQILATHTTAMAPSPATTMQPDATVTRKELFFAGATEQTTDGTISDENDESAVLDSEIKIDTESFKDHQPLSENPADLVKQSLQENISTNEKSVTLRQVDFSDEDFIPVQSKHRTLNEIEEENSGFEIGFDVDYTTILTDNELTTTLASTVPNEVLPERGESNGIALFDRVTTIKRRQTSVDEAIQTTTTTTQISVVAEALRKQATNKTEEESPLVNETSDEFGVLDSEILIPGQGNAAHEEDEEVSNNDITSAETNQTTTNSNQQQNSLSHTPSTISLTPTPTTTTKTISNLTTITTEPTEKQTANLMLHIRREDLEQQPTLDPSNSRKSLYYILKTKPVTNSSNILNRNESNSNNELVTAAQGAVSDSREVPRLEIIAQQPIDIHFSICPSACDKNHKHNIPTAGKRAVLLKWFARKSKQTLGFETSNEINADDA